MVRDSSAGVGKPPLPKRALRIRRNSTPSWGRRSGSLAKQLIDDIDQRPGQISDTLAERRSLLADGLLETVGTPGIVERSTPREQDVGTNAHRIDVTADARLTTLEQLGGQIAGSPKHRRWLAFEQALQETAVAVSAACVAEVDQASMRPLRCSRMFSNLRSLWITL